ELRIDGFGAARYDLAGDRDHTFQTKGFKGRDECARGVADALGNAVMVPEVDEKQVSVIAPAANPSGQANGQARIREPQLTATMVSILVHGPGLSLAGFRRRFCGGP